MSNNILIAASLAASLLCACHANVTNEKTFDTPTVQINFDADSAYKYIAEQVAFGPRVPNSASHEACLAYLTNTLTRLGATVEVQNGEGEAYDGSIVPVNNIIAHILPQKANRIILCAHWDSRPFADQDSDPSKRDMPIDGACDGASGVGVLMEIARQLQMKAPNIGVDIILFDTEDGGTPSHKNDVEYRHDSWCVGSQYWSLSNLGKDCQARFGILLDMVGATGAQFYREQYSVMYAKNIVDKVWSAAAATDHKSNFPDADGAYITDDHYYVNTNANVPCIDIIQYDNSTGSSFGAFWHTHNDNMDIIDRQTLSAVGETVLYVVYNER